MGRYKACDIRGTAAGELSAALYEGWGRSLGRRLGQGASCVVGGDLRLTTPSFQAALVEGFCQAGVEVVDLGAVPTPMVYYARRAWQAPGAAIVTASHSPAEVNGLKWMVGPLPPDEAEVRALQAEEGQALPAGLPRGTRVTADIGPYYAQWLRRTWEQDVPAGMSVVVDPGNGGWAGRARGILELVFPGLQVTAIHDQPDGSFPGRGPDCARSAALAALAAAVRDGGADAGIAFDGDGDRLALVDGGGHVLRAEEATWTLLHGCGAELPGRAFVYDIKFSDRIPEAAQRLGARPVPERSGHAFIRTRMIREQAGFGAEVSGHYFYGDLEGGDDALYTACRTVALLARGDSLEALRRSCPAIHATADLRVAMPPPAQERLIERVRQDFAARPQVHVDGVRVEFENGWALLRRSVTEAKLTLRFEGDSAASLEGLVRRFAEGFPELGSELWKQYRTGQGEG